MFLVVYFDDILIYCRSKAEHLEHLRLTFKLLRNEQLYLNLKKCSFLDSQVTFLGFIVSTQGLRANPKKVKAIEEWPKPQMLKEVHSFLGLATFYRQFIKGFGFSILVAPITSCIHMGENSHGLL